jgi:hypothetical protein
MRQIISTAVVAVVVGAVAGATMGAVAQSGPEATTQQAIVPSVTSINAHKVDGRHAVSASASRGKRRGKLVATNMRGYLPANIIKPAWRLIQDKPGAFADGRIGWGEVASKPGGFADGVDNGITGITITEVVGPEQTVNAGLVGLATATCPPGSKVIGGGFAVSAVGVKTFGSGRHSATAWAIGVYNSTGVSQTCSARAMCMSTDPATTISTASKGKKRK